MVRIRYNVNELNDEFISKPIESTWGMLRSRISRTNGIWRIVVEKQGSSDDWVEIINAEFTGNLAVAKAKAKRAMKELGVKFLEEVRRRRESNA